MVAQPELDDRTIELRLRAVRLKKSDERLSAPEIGRRIGVESAVVSQWFRELGLMRSGGRPRGTPKRGPFAPPLNAKPPGYLACMDRYMSTVPGTPEARRWLNRWRAAYVSADGMEPQAGEHEQPDE